MHRDEVVLVFSRVTTPSVYFVIFCDDKNMIIANNHIIKRSREDVRFYPFKYC